MSNCSYNCLSTCYEVKSFLLMENKQLLSKTFLSNMASYYKVGFSWLPKSKPSVDKNITLVKCCTSLETYCPGIVPSMYLFSMTFICVVKYLLNFVHK